MRVLRRIQGGICAVSGVRAGGVRDGNRGLALIVGGGPAAGMFTSNKLRAAPVEITSQRIRKKGRISAIIANSGCANAFTGDEGFKNAIKMGELVASQFNIPADEVAVASTGPIGKPLDMDLITNQFYRVVESLSDAPEGSAAAANAIMTTDTFQKEVAVAVLSAKSGDSKESGRAEGAERAESAERAEIAGAAEGVEGAEGEVLARIGGIAKGSGMIFPHLATMLAFIYTDAALSAETLRKCLREAVENSFNMIVVDGDMSTNDMVLLVSTGTAMSGCEAGEAGDEEIAAFQEGLNYVCKSLARMIARDGEGATKLLEVHVRGAASVEEARLAARSVARSPLVKCSLFGGKPFWGRVIAALGASGVEVERKQLKMWVSRIGNMESRDSRATDSKEDRKDSGGSGGSASRILVASDGKILNAKDARRLLRDAKEVLLEIDLGVGSGNATAWGCDLSYEYVRINAE